MPITLRQRKSVVVFAGESPRSDKGAQALASSLSEVGVEVIYLGCETDARRIAMSAADTDADAIEVCVAGRGAILLIRELLRELHHLDRRGVHIVVRRVN
jgi:methylmalonyl-CoA mutase cobalamin-binding domain/chain